MTRFHLKLLAVTFMLIDHIGAFLFPDVMLLRIIGRLALPCFAWFIAEGCHYTHSMRNYAARLLAVAVVSEFCVDFVHNGSFAMDWESQSIMLTLLMGVLSIWAMQKMGDLAGGAVALLCCCMAQVFQCDYKWYGVGLVLLFYYCQTVPARAVGYALLSVLWQWDMLVGWVADGRTNLFLEWPHQLWGLLAFIPLALYSGKQGKRAKLFFYLFYPAHLLVLGLLKLVI